MNRSFSSLIRGTNAFPLVVEAMLASYPAAKSIPLATSACAGSGAKAKEVDIPTVDSHAYKHPMLYPLISLSFQPYFFTSPLIRLNLAFRGICFNYTLIFISNLNIRLMMKYKPDCRGQMVTDRFLFWISIFI